MSDSLWPHGVQHTRLPCPPPTPRACSNSCPSSQWCHPAILSCALFFSSCLQSFLASGSFLIFLAIRWPGASASVLPVNIQNWFPLDWWSNLLAAQGTLKSLLQHSSKASILWCSTFLMVQLSHSYMISGKTIVLTLQTFVSKVMSLLFSMLSTIAIVFLPRSKYLLISWLQSPSTVEPQKIKPATISTFSASICHEVMEPDAKILVFECWVLSQLFHSPLSPSSRSPLVSLHFLPLDWHHLNVWGCCYVSQQSWFQLVIHPAWHFAWCILYKIK